MDKGGFRPEIEGLRAIAVLSVIFCHAEVPGFSGGFLGVDIFFVLSGYLITHTILRDLSKERFTLAGFYERRARRILPALFVMVMVTIPVAVVLLAYDSLRSFGQSVVATTLFANNLLLLQTSGYWAQASLFKPLLHTWSLGVEEQFYLIYPMIILCIHRHPRLLAIVVLAILIGSFGSSALLQNDYFDAVFYLLPTRAWELSFGALAALVPPVSLRPRGGLAIAGLVVIISAIATAEPEGMPVSGAAFGAASGTALLLLYARRGTIVAAILSAPPLARIGWMSYALYLWHQPAFAFFRVESLKPPTFRDYFPLYLVIFALAWLSTRFVEEPFREGSRVSGRVFIFTMAATAALLVATGFALHLSQGLPQRHFTAAVVGLTKDYNERVRRLASKGFRDDGRMHILLVGNSRARDFGNVLIEAGALKRYAVVYREFLDPCTAGFNKDALARKTDVMIVEAGSWRDSCLTELAPLRRAGTRLFVLGPRQFGYSIEPWLRLSLVERARLRVTPLPEYVAWNRELSNKVPKDIYVDYMVLLSKDGRGLPLFDERGELVSGDRMHLTQNGARLFAQRLSIDPRFDFLRD